MPGMVEFDQIKCQRGCESHTPSLAHVDLRQPHAYHDLTPVPADLAVEFSMYVWDPALQPVGGDWPYCPAHDAVSETVTSCGIWEPVETVLALRALRTAAEKQWFIDLGAQIGWYTMLAVACSVQALAIEADYLNAMMLRETLHLERGRVHPSTMVDKLRIGPNTPVMPVRPTRLAKLDLEGAEVDGLRLLTPTIEAGQLDFVLIEVTPAWGPYVRLLEWMIEREYDVFALPDKRLPPHVIDGTRASLEPWFVAPQDLRDVVTSRVQQDMWLARKGVEW